MKTSTVYHSLASAHGPLLQAVTQKILQAATIERLYLLGLNISTQRTESLFTAAPSNHEEVGHCFVLALLPKEEYNLSSIQDKIENNLQHIVPVTALVLSTTQFQSWLSEGHLFASAVCKKALLLYGTGDMPMPALPPNEAQMAQNKERLFAKTKTKVQAFLAGAELYTIRKEYGLAAFMLHQAAEQTLSAMFTVATGLQVHTHNLHKLLRYCALCGKELQSFSFERTEKEKRLFNLLQKAYIDARYGNDYAMGFDDLQTITEKVKWLHEYFK